MSIYDDSIIKIRKCGHGLMKHLLTAIVALLFFKCSSFAQAPVTLAVNTVVKGRTIPSDFIGLSFETGSLLPNYAGVNGYFFDSTNVQLLTLFRTIGVKSIRVGGGTVDNPAIPIPDESDIDAFFGFARAAGVKVIYSLRLAKGDPVEDAQIAKYIWTHYRNELADYAICNEPDYKKRWDPSVAYYPTYLPKWRRFAQVLKDSVPGAIIGGPDAARWKWGVRFARDERGTGQVASIFFHYYVAGVTRGKTPRELIDSMMSSGLDAVNYPEHFRSAESIGLPYRFTETNSYVTGLPEAWHYHNSYSTFATALYALDFMHWWAMAKGCEGVNFHTLQWKYNGTVYRDAKGDYEVYPMGYGIAAFNIGGHGTVDTVSMSNPYRLNMTAYAVSSPGGELFVTVINREHGPTKRDAEVNIRVPGRADSVMYLRAPGNVVSDLSGITLGGAQISSSTSWHGRWMVVNTTNLRACRILVPASSAAIVKISGAVTTHLR